MVSQNIQVCIQLHIRTPPVHTHTHTHAGVTIVVDPSDETPGAGAGAANGVGEGMGEKKPSFLDIEHLDIRDAASDVEDEGVDVI